MRSYPNQVTRQNPTRWRKPKFPVQVIPGVRYPVDAAGAPFIIIADTPWSILAALNNTQIASFVADRAAKGINTLMIEVPGIYFTPDGTTNNIDGVAPFTDMSGSWNWTLNNSYWARLDLLATLCLQYGILLIVNFAYLGYQGGSEGCMDKVTGASNGTLQAYGVQLGNRYKSFPNIWPCMGGDFSGDTTQRAKQAQIMTGLLSVWTPPVCTAHGSPKSLSSTSWDSATYPWHTFNFCYPDTENVYDWCATAWAAGLPFWMGEAIYENERDTPITRAGLRRQDLQAICSGAKGVGRGNNPIWHFSSPNGLYPGNVSGSWTTYMSSDGYLDLARLIALIQQYDIHLLEPKTDTSLVTTSLGTGDTRICPARASDGSFAWIFVPTNQTPTVNLAAIQSQWVRVSLIDPATSAKTHYATAANTGTLNVTTGAERLIVLEAA